MRRGSPARRASAGPSTIHSTPATLTFFAMLPSARTSPPRGIARPEEARTLTVRADAEAAFAPGARVFHAKFGYGRVMAADGDKMQVSFEKAGEKHVLASYLVAAERAADLPF